MLDPHYRPFPMVGGLGQVGQALQVPDDVALVGTVVYLQAAYADVSPAATYPWKLTKGLAARIGY